MRLPTGSATSAGLRASSSGSPKNSAEFSPRPQRASTCTARAAVHERAVPADSCRSGVPSECRWGRLAEPGFLVALASGGPPDRTGSPWRARARASGSPGCFVGCSQSLDSLRSLRTGRWIALRVQDPAPILVRGQETRVVRADRPVSLSACRLRRGVGNPARSGAPGWHRHSVQPPTDRPRLWLRRSGHRPPPRPGGPRCRRRASSPHCSETASTGDLLASTCAGSEP